MGAAPLRTTDAAQRVKVVSVSTPDPLVAALLKGDRDAWARMFDTYAESMRAVAKNKTGNDDLANEAVQQLKSGRTAFRTVLTTGRQA